jgi:hypothetical protein
LPRLANQPPNVTFFGAAHLGNEAAGANYFADSGGKSAETGLAGGAEGISAQSATILSTICTKSLYLA